MTAIPGQIVSGAVYVNPSPFLSTNLSGFATSVYGSWVHSPSYIQAGGGYSRYYDPVAQPLSVPGQMGGSFYDDFYNRIHVAPAALNLGNLTSSQTRTFTVWNAYSEPKLLSSLGVTGNAGITLTQPFNPPTSFAGNEERTYTLNISTNGPPIVDAKYTFNFPGVSPTFKVVGRRVVVWPYLPETGYQEKLEWKTDILPSYKKEQRLALRDAPRQSFELEFFLNESQFSRAKAISTQWAHRIYAIPVWSEVTQLENGVASGATVINFDTTNADYRADDMILLWSSDTNYLALEITTVTTTSVTLKLAMPMAFGKCYVAPLRFAQALAGVSYSRDSNAYITANATFDVTSGKDLAAEGTYPTYRSKIVLTDRTTVVGSINERISRSIDVFDNGSGPVQVEVNNNWTRHLQTIGFVGHGRAKIWTLRKWFHARRGKQKTFWLPSWNKDLNILLNVVDSANSITVESISYPVYYTVKDILIQLKSGTRIFNRITGGSTDANGRDVLALSSPIVTGFAVSDVDFVCFMSHVRLDTDTVTIQHYNYGEIGINVAVTETPEA